MKKKASIIMSILFSLCFVGCNAVGSGKISSPESETNKSSVSQGNFMETKESESTNNKNSSIGTKEGENESIYIHVFTKEEMKTEPEIEEYDFKKAQKLGEVQELQGMLPGASEGTWYIVVIEGVEYYYGKYDSQEIEDMTLYGYAIIDDQHALANGLSVGMTENDVLEQYPNMAVIDFEGNDIYKKVTGYLGWNGTAYPRSYAGMDSNWEYDGEYYEWTNQFDYVMVADIDIGEDTLPRYVALLMKNKAVAAITFYYPTAG